MKQYVDFWKRFDESRNSRPIQEIAEIAGTTKGALDNKRTLKTLPKVELTFALAKALGVSAYWLVEGEEESFDSDITLLNKVKRSPRLMSLVRLAVDADDHSLELAELALSRPHSEDDTNKQPVLA